MRLPYEPLSLEERRRLHRSYQKCRRRSTRDRLLSAYSPLALGLARRFTIHPNHAEDLQSAAVRGLLEALSRFDAEVGVDFETYAYFWIWKFILRERELDRSLVRIPTSVARAHRRVRRRIQMGDTLEELAREFGQPIGALQRLLELYDSPLCEPYPEGAIRPDEQMPADPDLPGQLEALRQLLPRLPEPQRTVVYLRFLDPEAPVSYRAIGRKLRVGAETARQAYNSALSALRTLLKDARQMD